MVPKMCTIITKLENIKIQKLSWQISPEQQKPSILSQTVHMQTVTLYCTQFLTCGGLRSVKVALVQYDTLCMIKWQCIAGFDTQSSFKWILSLIQWACATSIILDPLLRKNVVQWWNSYWRSASLLNTATGTILPRGLVWEGLPRQERQSWGLFLWIDNE